MAFFTTGDGSACAPFPVDAPRSICRLFSFFSTAWTTCLNNSFTFSPLLADVCTQAGGEWPRSRFGRPTHHEWPGMER